VDKIRIWIDFFAFGKKDFSVRTFFAGDKEDNIMLLGKFFDVWYTV
jgi:Iap family predicted aminopeptidase